jgi:hypothetical protein
MSEDDELHAGIPSLDNLSRRALSAAEEWIGGDIQGVAIGATDDGEPVVVVYALDPASAAVQALPQECEGLPVRVETGDAFRAED